MQSIVKELEEKNILFPLEYYGQNDYGTYWDIKSVLDNRDYFKNRIYRGLSAQESYVDYLHDKDVNAQGRFQAKTGLYKNSRDGCNYLRVNGINERY